MARWIRHEAKERGTDMAFKQDRRVRIIPTVFATDLHTFNKRLKRLEKSCDEIQIDMMDGRFVKKRSIPLNKVPELRRKKARFEAHLMVKDPEKLIAALSRKGFKRAIAHVEALDGTGRIESFIKSCKRSGMEAGLAINPGTPLSKIKPHLGKIDLLLFLGVKPGKEGQKLKRQVLPNIRRFRKMAPAVPAQIDGGVDPKTAKRLAAAGITRFNTGAYTSNSTSPRDAIEKIREAAKQGLEKAWQSTRNYHRKRAKKGI